MIVINVYLLIGVVAAFLIAKFLKPDVSDPKLSMLGSPQVQRVFLVVVALLWPILLLGVCGSFTKKEGGK